MDGQVGMDIVLASNGEETALIEAASTEFLQHWRRLVSTTNWEKGRIISAWRNRLLVAGASAPSCSDETWSRLAGSVTGQHVGRLRRVWDRFGGVHGQYPGLYWSHFQAALDWDDAEMWLEGAVQSVWSIAEMRTNRWETLGGPADQKPREQDIVAAELDEDADPSADPFGNPADNAVELIRDPANEDSVHEPEEADGEALFDPEADMGHEAPASQPVRPFENLGRLPDDLAEAFEAFKLAILSHKLTGWEDVSCGEVLAALDALKTLAIAPSEG